MAMNHAIDFRVAGVMKDIPHNSTIRFDVWAPLELTREFYRENYLDTWYNLAFKTYVLMDQQVSYESFNEKIKDRIRQSDPKTILEPLLFPFNRVYMEWYNRKESIRLFSLIALFILIIACINFMNLTTARSARRAREVGLRKVVGAERAQLIRQFFSESILYILFSLGVAILLAYLCLPAFRTLTAKPLQIQLFGSFTNVLGIAGIVLIAGILAGSYPALYLSSFRPVRVLAGPVQSAGRGGLFRKILVVTQFTLSIILIIGTIVIFHQVRFMKNKALGFEKEHLVYIMLEGELKDSYESVRYELMKDPGITHISMTSHSPTGIYWNGQDWKWEGKDPNVNPLITFFCVDDHFLETFQMNLAEGRFFTPNPAGSGTDVIINERLVEIMGSESGVGSRLMHDDRSLTVIGVIKDFHFKPVYRDIEPMIIINNPEARAFRYMFIRISPQTIERTLTFIEQTINRFNPNFPFEYHFLDEDYEQLYRRTERFTQLIQTFTLLAIVISCLGLFGLASYMAEQRTKEIGIRKVMGASVSAMVVLLSKEFARWVCIANILAWPVSYWIMHKWLQDFAYRISLTWWIFGISALCAFVVALLTVSYQALKAATANPVNALRYE